MGAMASGYVTNSANTPATREPDDTAEVRHVIGKAQGCERLEQRVLAFGGGRSRPRKTGGRQGGPHVRRGGGEVRGGGRGVLYVVAGEGTIEVEGEPHALDPGTAAYVRPRETYVVENAADDPLL